MLPMWKYPVSRSNIQSGIGCRILGVCALARLDDNKSLRRILRHGGVRHGQFAGVNKRTHKVVHGVGLRTPSERRQFFAGARRPAERKNRLFGFASVEHHIVLLAAVAEHDFEFAVNDGELRRRYPKHAWPDRPLDSAPVRGVKKKNGF